MKRILVGFLISSFSISAIASSPLESFHRELDTLNKDYQSKGCPITWSLEDKNITVASSLDKNKMGAIIFSSEYPIRMKCPAISKKITAVKASCGTIDSKFDPSSDANCSPAIVKAGDAATVKLSGTTLTITGKYKNCFCTGNLVETQVKKILEGL